MYLRKLAQILIFLLLCLPLHAGDFFKDEPKRILVIVEGVVGGDFYRSPLSPLYKTDQYVFASLVNLGYKFNNNFISGIGGGLRHCQNDQKTGFPIAGSFPIYVMGRYTFSKIWQQPYIDGRAGIVAYPKWNDNVKPQVAVGGGIHILPCLTIGVQCAWYGTLDNRHTLSALFSLGFIL